VSDPPDSETEPQTLPRLLRPILDPPEPDPDPAVRRTARLLAGLLAILIVVFGTSDLVLVLTRTGYKPPWLGYAFLLGSWLLNRHGRHGAAAALTLAMFPIVIFGEILGGTVADPRAALSFLLLGILVASILLSPRGTLLFAAANVAGMLLLPVVAPATVPSLRTIFGSLVLCILVAGLVLVSMLHRDRIERDRQALLRDGEERLRLALEAAHMASWEWNVRTGTVRWSEGAAKILGRAPGGAPASIEDYLRLVLPDDRSAVQESMRAVLAGEAQRYLVRHRVPAAEGPPRWVEAHGRVDRDCDGRPVRTRGTVFDVTDRQGAEAEREELIRELERKNAELERFSYTVSHDLKSPLITIRGFLGFVEKDAADGRIDRLHHDVERIVKATDRMQRLLDEVLQLSRIGWSANPPERASFETVAREGVALVRARLEARRVEVAIDPDLPEVCGDRLRLVALVQNLVENAVKFLGDQASPRIRIGTRPGPDGSLPVLFVEDNGIGIEPAFHEKVLGLFEKLDSRTEGTGVGLALVKRIVEVHGGRVWIESEGRGRGTTVCFTIPGPPPHAKAVPSLPA